MNIFSAGKIPKSGFKAFYNRFRNNADPNGENTPRALRMYVADDDEILFSKKQAILVF